MVCQNVNISVKDAIFYYSISLNAKKTLSPYSCCCNVVVVVVVMTTKANLDGYSLTFNWNKSGEHRIGLDGGRGKKGIPCDFGVN